MMSGFPDAIVAQQGLPPQIPILTKPFALKRLRLTIEDVLANPQVERTIASLADHSPSNNSSTPMAQSSSG